MTLPAILAVAALFIAGVPAMAEFKPYPGAKPDPALQKLLEDSEREATGELEGRMTVFVSNDPFEKVHAFYNGLGREYELPDIPGLASNGHERELPSEINISPEGIKAAPSGIKVKQAYVIFDDTDDPDESKDMVSISRPFVPSTSTDGTRIEYGAPRDVTVIVRMEKD